MDLASILLFLLIGILEIVSVWLVRSRLKYEHDFMVERGTVGEQFGEWLMGTESDAEDAPTRLQALSAVVGASIAKTQRFSSMQELSVDSRAFNKYDGEIQEAVKKQMPIGYKFIFKIAEQLGFDLNEIMEAGELTQFINAAKNNRLDLLMGNDGGSTSPRGKM